jgi:hypothetical protein
VTAVHNERTKLLANALDRASTVCLTVGIATPVAGYLYNIGGLRAALSPLALAAGMGAWLLCAVLLHLMARRVLGRLLP